MKIGNLNMLKTEIARAVLAIGFIVGMAFGVYSCDCGTDVPRRVVHVSGIISDSLTRMALPNALVTYGDTASHHPTVSSDTAGAYQLDIAEGTTVVVWAGKAGYRAKTRSLGSLQKDEAGVNFELAHDTQER
jgi:hypothetical protein